MNRKTYTTRQRWLRTLMQNLLWAGLAATMLGLTGGAKALAGATPDAVYRQAPVSPTGALVLLLVGPALVVAAAAVADRVRCPRTR